MILIALCIGAVLPEDSSCTTTTNTARVVAPGVVFGPVSAEVTLCP